MFSIAKVKGQRSENIQTMAVKLIEVIGKRVNKSAYDTLGKIEAAARKQRGLIEAEAIRQGKLVKTVTSVSQIPATERKNYTREWVA